jgi:hypothetical protein
LTDTEQEQERPLLCPSANCNEGALLLGIVNQDGKVSFLTQSFFVDNEFVKITKIGRKPEKRFRFSNWCIRTSCEQWTGCSCGVIEKVIEILKPEEPSQLPNCIIRKECRWYNQCGGKACAVCPGVVTDLE